MKVYNMTSDKGNKVPNQFVVEHNGYKYFQSYDTVIAKIDWNLGGVIYLDKRWDYSRTTCKYLYKFLGYSRKAIEKDIAGGEINIVDFNGLEL